MLKEKECESLLLLRKICVMLIWESQRIYEIILYNKQLNS